MHLGLFGLNIFIHIFIYSNIQIYILQYNLGLFDCVTYPGQCSGEIIIHLNVGF